MQICTRLYFEKISGLSLSFWNRSEHCEELDFNLVSSFYPKGTELWPGYKPLSLCGDSCSFGQVTASDAPTAQGLPGAPEVLFLLDDLDGLDAVEVAISSNSPSVVFVLSNSQISYNSVSLDVEPSGNVAVVNWTGPVVAFSFASVNALKVETSDNPFCVVLCSVSRPDLSAATVVCSLSDSLCVVILPSTPAVVPSSMVSVSDDLNVDSTGKFAVAVVSWTGPVVVLSCSWPNTFAGVSLCGSIGDVTGMVTSSRCMVVSWAISFRQKQRGLE